MVLRSNKYLTLVLTLSTVLLTLVVINNIQIVGEIDQNSKVSGVKKIVAYSLLKQIENESEEYFCDDFNFNEVSVTNDTNENNLWTNIVRTNLFVYSVHLDTRLDPYHYIRIIGMTKGKLNTSVYCQISTNDGFYHIIKPKNRKIWNDKWNQNDTNTYYNPVLLSCKIPIGLVSTSLAISKVPCKIAKQKFSIKSSQLENYEKTKFTVCVKPLKFTSDISNRLLQWLEINKILGANKIEIYLDKIHKTTRKFLKWYKNNNQFGLNLIEHKNVENNVESSRMKYVWQKRRYEVIIYNDCLYRNLHKTQFILPIDIDEIIIPRDVKTWKELLNKAFTSATLQQEKYASFTVVNTYYLNGFTTNKNKQQKEVDVYFFKNNIRTGFSSKGESGKSFISTDNSLTVFNHYTLDVLRPGTQRNFFLDSSLVQMNHYKNNCDYVIFPECLKYFSSPIRIFDPVVSKYKSEFYPNYYKVFKKLTDLKLL